MAALLTDIRMKTTWLLGLTVLLTLLHTSRGSFLADNDLGERRQAEAEGDKQLDILVDYLIKRIQSEQEHPSYSRTLVDILISYQTSNFILTVTFNSQERLIPKTKTEKRRSFNNNYADAVFRGLG